MNELSISTIIFLEFQRILILPELKWLMVFIPIELNRSLMDLDHFRISKMYEELIRKAVEEHNYLELAGQLTSITFSMINAHRHINEVVEKPNTLNANVQYLFHAANDLKTTMEKQHQETIDQVSIISNETELNSEHIKDLQDKLEEVK